MQNNGNFGRWLRNWVILALGILVVSKAGLVEGIRCTDGLTLLVVVVLLSLLNSLLRPILMVVAMPLIVLSFGLFLFPAIWVINASILYLVGNVIHPEGFHVTSFSAAMWGSLWISIISWLLNLLIGGAARTGAAQPARPRRAASSKDDDVIDV